MKQHISRRSFHKRTAACLAAGAASLGTNHQSFAALLQNDQETPSIEYRSLGKTGLKYTTLGFGAMRTSDAAVIRRAIDLGVNNIDTARGYMGGTNETIVGQAVKDVRDQVHITTKIKGSSIENMLQDIDKSLKALDTEYVDVLLLHGLRSADDVTRQEFREVATKAKKDGKARFVGFSTHSNMAEIIRAAIKNPFFDVILTAYNFTHDENMKKAIAEAAAAGIGIIAMKTQAGGYTNEKIESLNPNQAALKWVLSDKNVTSAIPSMVNFDQVEENFQVMGASMGWLDRKALFRYADVVDQEFCRACGQCEPQCPKGVAIPDVNRCIMYFDGYGDPGLALMSYSEIPALKQAEQCRDCMMCPVKCQYNLPIAQKMHRALELFA